MQLESYESKEIRVIWGMKDGDSSTAGCTRQQFTIASTGASLASGVTSVNSAFEVHCIMVKSDADISSGVSIILGHPGGSKYNHELDAITMNSEDFVTWYPDSRLIIPSSCSLMVRSSAPKVTGSTRYHSMIVSF